MHLKVDTLGQKIYYCGKSDKESVDKDKDLETEDSEDNSSFLDDDVFENDVVSYICRHLLFDPPVLVILTPCLYRALLKRMYFYHLLI